MNFQGGLIGAEACDPAPPGSPQKRNVEVFQIKIENCYPPHSTLKIKIALEFLKVACPYNPY
jgi:hypothetical protein